VNVDIEIKLLKNFQVEATIGAHTIKADQAKDSGGDGTAPNPFEYFMASVGLCAAHYVNAFCKQRDIPTEGIKIVERISRDQSTNKMTFETIINVPASFPSKYNDALVKVTEGCAVKKAIMAGPSFKVTLESNESHKGDTK
jgi:putative redox protein